MRYSIHSRFRGTLLGMAVGEIVGNSQRQTSLLSQTEVNSKSPQQALFDVVFASGKNLIANQRFVPEVWCSSMRSEIAASPAASLLVALPLAVLYHENELKLQQNLQLALVALGRDEPEYRDGVLAIGYAVATAIQAKLDPKEAIAQTLAFVGTSSTATSAKLNRVKLLLDERAGLERAIAQLGKPAQISSQIALAFFCCFSTSADFQLAIQRATIGGGTIGAIAGALSGAYNGMASISATQTLTIGMTKRAEVLRLCDELVAVWSGVYEQSDRATATNQIAAIAAPKIVRRR